MDFRSHGKRTKDTREIMSTHKFVRFHQKEISHIMKTRLVGWRDDTACLFLVNCDIGKHDYIEAI